MLFERLGKFLLKTFRTAANSLRPRYLSLKPLEFEQGKLFDIAVVVLNKIDLTGEIKNRLYLK